MILKAAESTVECSNDFEAKEFSIKQEDMGIVLSILRDKIYSNPVGALCREVASNACDAHREVNNPDPIEIGFDEGGIWSAADLSIYFKDNGPGISPQRVNDIFINYGASTKRDSNEMKGGWGLGAKCPFAYTDNFTVVTVVDKVRYVYTAAIEAQRRGRLYLLSKTETTEPNGTAIVVPVQQQDRGTFESEVRRATRLWDVLPKLVNFITVDDGNVKILDNTEKFAIMCDSNGHGLNALVDGISYPIDVDTINRSYRSSNCDDRLNLPYGYSFYLKFNIGDLTVAANRESIQHDEATIAKIKVAFEELEKFASEELKKHFASATTFFEACIMYSEAKSDHSRAHALYELLNRNGGQKEIPDEWNGQELATSFYDLDIRSFNIIKVQKKTGGIGKLSSLDKALIDGNVYVQDLVIKSPGRILTLQSEAMSATEKESILLEPDDKRVRNWQNLTTFRERKNCARAMRKVLKELEILTTKFGIKVKRFSEIAITRIPKVAGTPTARVIKVRTVSTSGWSRRRHGEYGEWGSESYSISKFQQANAAPIVCFVEKAELFHSSAVLRTERAWAKVIQGEDSKNEVLFILERDKLYIKNYTLLSNAVKKLQSTILQKIADCSHCREVDVSEYIDKDLQTALGVTVATAAELIRKTKENEHKRSHEELVKANALPEPSEEIKSAVKAIEDVKKKYPLLRHYERYYDDRKQEFLDYIKVIDEYEALKAKEIKPKEISNDNAGTETQQDAA